eukprot:6475805-Amphidinium_carterae.2
MQLCVCDGSSHSRRDQFTDPFTAGRVSLSQVCGEGNFHVVLWASGGIHVTADCLCRGSSPSLSVLIRVAWQTRDSDLATRGGVVQRALLFQGLGVLLGFRSRGALQGSPHEIHLCIQHTKCPALLVRGLVLGVPLQERRGEFWLRPCVFGVSRCFSCPQPKTAKVVLQLLVPPEEPSPPRRRSPLRPPKVGGVGSSRRGLQGAPPGTPPPLSGRPPRLGPPGPEWLPRRWGLPGRPPGLPGN